VDSSLVDLWLVTPTGDSIRYATTGRPGQFAVVTTVDAGERYRLFGTVAGHAVTAQVSVPGALLVAQPAADTLRLSLQDAFSRQVPFVWRADSAASYQALLVDNDGTSHTVLIVRPANPSRLVDMAPDTTGELLIIPPIQGVPDTAPLVILGYDRTAAAFYSSTTKGNVHGAFGLFGAAAKAERVVVWE
jgi:hypothetical protein